MASPRVVIVAGVRPQYVKTRAVLHLLQRYRPHLLDTTATIDIGQHYSPELSDLIIQDLGFNFDHRFQTAAGTLRGVIVGEAIARLSTYFASLSTKPCVVVFGDAASVVAGAFAAYNAELPLVHIEAGARRDPAEVEHHNSVIVDQLATFRLPYSKRAFDALCAEGLSENSQIVGDVAFEWYLARYPDLFKIAQRQSKEPILVSMHRPANMDETTLLTLAQRLVNTGREVRWLSFPRTRAFFTRLERVGVSVIPSLTHSDTMAELAGAGYLLTDSGGLSREAHYVRCPVIMRRDIGGWPELANEGYLYRLHGRTSMEVQQAIDWAESVSLPDPSLSPLIFPGGGRRIAEAIDSLADE